MWATMTGIIRSALSAQKQFMVFSALVILTTCSLSYSQPQLVWLGTLGGNFSDGVDLEVSGSDVIVVGNSRNSAGYDRAFYWSRGSGMIEITPLSGYDSSWASRIKYGMVCVNSGARNNRFIRKAAIWSGGSLDPVTGWWFDTTYHVINSPAIGSYWSSDTENSYNQRCGYIYVGGSGRSYSTCSWWNDALLPHELIDSDDGYIVGFYTASASGIPNYKYVGVVIPLNADPNTYSIIIGDNCIPRSIVGGHVVGTIVPPISTRSSPFYFNVTSRQRIDLRGRGFHCSANDVSRDGTRIVGSGEEATDERIFYYPLVWQRDISGQWLMFDLNRWFSSGGSYLISVNAISQDGRYITGRGYNAATRRIEAYLADLQSIYLCESHSGDVNNNRCVDDADLLAVLFAFGRTGNNLGRVDVNCDRVVDDADLLQVLFNFGSGC